MHNGPDMISKDRPNNQGVKLGKVTFVRDGQVGIKLDADLYKQDVLELRLKDGNVVEITSGSAGYKNGEVSLKCPKTKLIQIGQTVLRTRCNHIISDIEKNILENTPKYELYGELSASVGKELEFTIGRNIEDKYFKVSVLGEVVS